MEWVDTMAHGSENRGANANARAYLPRWRPLLPSSQFLHVSNEVTSRESLGRLEWGGGEVGGRNVLEHVQKMSSGLWHVTSLLLCSRAQGAISWHTQPESRTSHYAWLAPGVVVPPLALGPLL